MTDMITMLIVDFCEIDFFLLLIVFFPVIY
jgi:hypothetical protein